mmetsp:Transcript_27066/g.40969  ORF Transcript_27066/g.40969 Transcript_27066/m.40969 type:complete len:271 (+) Transcript_27066:212-1024(+)|eukprot:CAMPEP_0178908924 /NCGR_PEP_ID=MMETSP0786-20121207/8197_1 /TAXON_ID=186022 /ORGANISM="Thalassionema frauenfeldii, Strain CCMP 1798" /LENGTH=270 /DNA_ID=CAMNT_0020580889 /DNA_START=184 /DNA_END=996 /DNA_ORIENTATION=-
MSLISLPTNLDILLGKDSSVYNHDGNRRFRSIIYDHLEKYLSAHSRSSKSKIIQELHDYLKNKGHRFLRKIESSLGIRFVEIQSREARQKVSHALRDGAREYEKKKRASSKMAVSVRKTSVAKIISAKTRRHSSKRTIGKDLTTTELLMDLFGEPHSSVKIVPEKTRRPKPKRAINMDLAPKQSLMKQSREQYEDVPNLVAQAGSNLFHPKYYDQKPYPSFITSMDEQCQDCEPLNPSMENGFIYSYAPCVLAKQDDQCVDRFLSVARSL